MVGHSLRVGKLSAVSIKHSALAISYEWSAILQSRAGSDQHAYAATRSISFWMAASAL
jgi:hypothetical protein